MRFQVPQFTEVEDKIIGPFTFKQFVYLAGAGGAVVALFFVLPTFIAIFFALPIAAFGAALAFYKVNGQPFIRVVEAWVTFTVTKKLYLWKHEEKQASAKQMARPINASAVPKLSESKLRDLMWSMDVKQSGNPTNEEEVR